MGRGAADRSRCNNDAEAAGGAGRDVAVRALGRSHNGDDAEEAADDAVHGAAVRNTALEEAAALHCAAYLALQLCPFYCCSRCEHRALLPGLPR